MSGAIDSTSILAICFSGGSGSVLVSTMRSIGAFFRRSTAAPGQHAVRRHRPHLGGAALDQQLGGRGDRAAGVDHVVGEHAQPAGDVADHLDGLGDVGGALGPALVAEREVGAAVAEVLGHALGDLDPPGVGRHDDRARGVLAQVLLEHRHRREVVDRAVEEALDLAGVQVDRDHPLGPGGLEHVGDEAGGDRLAAFGLAVLAGVAVERAHGGDPLGRRPVGGVAHDQLLHDRVVDGAPVDAVVALQDEHVAAAHALGEARLDLAVGELDDVGLAELDAEVVGDLLRRAAGWVRPVKSASFLVVTFSISVTSGGSAASRRCSRPSVAAPV